MRLATVRSGLTESFDDVTAIALGDNDAVLHSFGEVDRPMYYRSAIKPLQALAARRAGLNLPPEHLALSCASHKGWPVHVSSVEAILRNHGLTPLDLGTPPDRPSSRNADSQLIAKGDTGKRPIFHVCSGKHAGWLAACKIAGWETASYLAIDHPLQRSIREIIAEYTGVDPNPTGVDGCGAPTLVGSVRGLAKGFRSVETVSEFASIATAMTRFGSMVSDNVSAQGRVGTTWGGPQKVGAQGCYAMSRQGVAIATKSHSGSEENAVTVALHVADRLGLLSDGMVSALEPQLFPPVFGGGRIVGHRQVVDA